MRSQRPRRSPPEKIERDLTTVTQRPASHLLRCLHGVAMVGGSPLLDPDCAGDDGDGDGGRDGDVRCSC